VRAPFDQNGDREILKGQSGSWTLVERVFKRRRKKWTKTHAFFRGPRCKASGCELSSLVRRAVELIDGGIFSSEGIGQERGQRTGEVSTVVSSASV
jgi:hypothetical protein